MLLITDNHPFRYETENLCRAFYPYENIKTVKSLKEIDNNNTNSNIPSDYDKITCFTSIKKRDDSIFLQAKLITPQGEYCSEKRLAAPEKCDFLSDESGADAPKPRGFHNKAKDTFRDKCELVLAQAMFDVLTRAVGKRPKWGISTGVRPVKLFFTLLDTENGEEGAVRYFQNELLVSREKTELTRKTAEKQKPVLALSRPDSFSLYISVPFCPTRCAYCSFVSQSIEKAARLIPKYVELLCREIEITGSIAEKLGLRLETVYFGGGTPTSLTAHQLDEIMLAVERSFDMSRLREYTVEAGRPDTITGDKLQTLKDHSVGRISVNPQTLSDEVLQAICRRHTAQQAVDAFILAKKYGFDINMDIIAGLPLDTLGSFRNTVDTLLSMQPHNLTVHTLSMKRSSALTKSGAHPSDEQISQMLDSAADRLDAAGFYPYYLYRQSRILGNQENTGWTVPGKECLYNIYIMDETHTILACGASAVTKLRQPHANRIERIFNYKFPYEYNDKFDILMQRKEQITGFYEGFSNIENK